MVLGFLGVGHLASYTVEGLRHGGDQRRIILSPRNASVAARLASEYSCEVANSNQSVVDQSDVVVLSVRPDTCPELLQDLRFKPAQLVLSVMAGLSTDYLQQFACLADVQLVRSLPIQCAAVGQGPVPVYPSNAQAEALLAPLGSVVALKDETQFELACTMGCMHGWVYPWLAAMSEWGQQQGLDAQASGQLTQAAVAGAVAYSQAQGPESMAAIGAAIATEGTYTLRGLEILQQQGGLQAWINAMDAVTSKPG